MREASILRCTGSESVVQVERLAAKINDLCRLTTLDLALQVGALIIQELYGGKLESWERDGTGHISYRQLSARGDLLLSPSALCRSVAVFVLVERLGGRARWRSLAISHFQEVLSLTQAEQARLLGEAEAEGWTVTQLRKQVGLVRSCGPRPGARSLVKALRRARVDIADGLTALRDVRVTELRSVELGEATEIIERLREELGALQRAIALQADSRAAGA